MERVIVVGMTGAGKTTAARRLAARLGVPFHEVDALAIGPGWSVPATFESEVAAILATPRWVLDSFAPKSVRTQVWRAADTVVWLDYSRARILTRVVRRSLGRSLLRRPVFGGNRETWRGWLRSDHPVWWAMSELRNRRRVLTELTVAASHATVVRFRRPAELARWMDDGHPAAVTPRAGPGRGRRSRGVRAPR